MPPRSAGPPLAPSQSADTPSEPGLEPGLYLVATPIGNLDDITLRALSVLRSADRIFCEDSRVTRKLLTRYGIGTRLETYHDHNAEEARPLILAALHQGASVALVSDAGTPLVSDPGYKLVRAAIAENLPVTALPGPSSAVTALILSGLPPDKFLYGGFLPPRRTARRRILEGWAAVDATLVFFESPQRLAETLADMKEVFGDRPAAVARELTKLHEEVSRGRLANLADHYGDAGPPRGEIVIVVGQPEPGEPDSVELEALMRSALAQLGLRDAVAKLALETGLPRNELYRRALAIRQSKQ
jgi:16S rRNA (cytidine1402-2'-O)-methyltransferase